MTVGRRTVINSLSIFIVRYTPLSNTVETVQIKIPCVALYRCFFLFVAQFCGVYDYVQFSMNWLMFVCSYVFT